MTTETLGTAAAVTDVEVRVSTDKVGDYFKNSSLIESAKGACDSYFVYAKDLPDGRVRLSLNGVIKGK